MKIARGMRVIFKPEWRDPGDDDVVFIAIDEPDPLGSLSVSYYSPHIFVCPINHVRVDMIERAEPCAPIITISFVRIARSHGRNHACVCKRTDFPDGSISKVTEMVSMADFRAVFRKSAKECQPNETLISDVDVRGATLRMAA
jgi:hypothetical protein